MIEVVSVRFNNRGKVYFFDPSGLKVSKGDNVIVETAKGAEYGQCTRGNHSVEELAVVRPLRPVTRLATEEDNQKALNGKAKEKEAFEYCQDRILDFGLDMKLVDVEYGFEGNKILFFFTSEGRVDFRELVKDLAGTFRTRIELRQIGVRDEAKMLGGLGFCGRPFCCTQFMNEFHPVSIKMAKTQGLSLNPTKISGTCGRLMCCLKYEENAYEDLVKKAPKVDAFVETPSGKGSIVGINLLRGSAKVRLEDGADATLKNFAFDELVVLGGKGRRAEYIAAKAEGRLEEAGFQVAPPAETGRLSNQAPSSAGSRSNSTGRTQRNDSGRDSNVSDRQRSAPRAPGRTYDASSAVAAQVNDAATGEGLTSQATNGEAPRDAADRHDPNRAGGSQNKKPPAKRYKGRGKGR